MKKLPNLSSVDQVNKLKLWLSTEIVEQGSYDINELYNLLKNHFDLIAKYEHRINK